MILRMLKDHGYGGFVHGDCVGADTEAALIATRLGLLTVSYPASHVVNSPAVVRHDVQKPLVRNKLIVEASDVLVACPRLMKEELRSGTWATIRYARKEVGWIIIVWPDGKITQEGDREWPVSMST
jgi:hypothetical protein